MRQISLSTLVTLLVLLACDTPDNVEPSFEKYFTKYYGVDGEQEAVDMVVNNDGSMVLLGNSYSQTDPISPFIVKTDPAGNILWQFEFEDNNEQAVDVELINNGAQLAVLTNVQASVTNIRIYIIGQDGSAVNNFLIEKTTSHVGRSVSQISDNSFLVTGYKDPDPARNPLPVLPSQDQADILLLNVSADFSTVTDLSPGGGEHVGSGVQSYEINFGNDRYFLVLGSSDRPRELGSDVFQMCFQVIASNPSATPVGLHGVSRAQANEQQVASAAIRIPPAAGDGYLVVGTTSSGGSSDLYLTRFNKPQNPNAIASSLDAKIPLGRRLEGVAAANATPDGFFVLANEIKENNRRDISLLRIQRDGAVSWSKTFGSLEGEDTGGAVEVLPDGRVAVAGTIQLETQKKIVLIVTNANGAFSD